MSEQLPADDGAMIRLDEIWLILQANRHIVAMFVVPVVAIGLIGTLLTTKQYSASTIVQVSPVQGREFNSMAVVNTELHNLRNVAEFQRTQIEILRSRLVRDEVARRYKDDLGFDDPPVTSAALANILTVSPLPNSELLRVGILYQDPERAAVLANLVTEVYRAKNLEVRRDAAREARTWLGEKILEYEKRIADGNAAVLTYQSENNLADAEEDITELSTRMSALNVALGDVATERVLLETTYNTHSSLLSRKRYDDLEKDMDTVLVGTLSERYARAVSESANISARYGEKHPKRLALDAEVERIEAELRSEVEQTLTAERVKLDMLRAKEANLQLELSEVKGQFLARQELINNYSNLHNQLSRASAFYETLSKRNDELDLQAQTQLNNVRIIETAIVPLTHSKPNLMVNLLIALATGLAGGIALVVLREQVDDTISTPLDVATYLHLPYLGSVPRLEDVPDGPARALFTHHQPGSAAAESIRAVRTVLELNPTQSLIRRLMLTSAVAAEGKTETTIRLAVAFAKLGKRVVVVDGDLRRPRVHRVFELQRDPGLVNVLQLEVSLATAVRSTPIDNVDILPSGPSVQHPSELLATTKMSQILEELEQTYDVILLDSPPSGLLSDGLVLSKLVDGVVLVVRGQATSRKLVRHAGQRLQQVGATLLGVVINAARNSGATYYYYQSDHTYGDDLNEEAPDAAAK